MIWQQLTVDADVIATTEDAVITTVVVLSGLSFFCAAAAVITAAVVDAVTVVAVAEMMVVAVGFGSSFFCSAVAAADSAADSAAKQNIKQGPNHLWFGPCLRLITALTFLLSRSCKSGLVTCSFLAVSVLLLFHTLIINFVNRISIYD